MKMLKYTIRWNLMLKYIYRSEKIKSYKCTDSNAVNWNLELNPEGGKSACCIAIGRMWF